MRAKGLGAVVAACLAAGTAHADGVIEVTAEEAGAVDAAKADVARAQDLGKQQDYAGAVTLLVEVAYAHPASEHDCNLALAYLRVGDPTRAQLWADVAGKRGGARPKWCTSKLPGQLAAALGGMQPVTLVVTPADATVEVEGIALRGLDVIWLPAGAHEVDAHADGFASSTTQVAVTDAPTRVELALEIYVEPVPEPDPEPDPDPVAVPMPVHISVPAEARPPLPWPGFVAAGLGAIGIAIGGYFHAAALSAADAADMRYPSDPAFPPLADEFRDDRTFAITGYAVGATLIAAGAWWVLTHEWRP